MNLCSKGSKITFPIMKNDSNSLKTDLYELTMAAGYFQNNLNLRAVFELYCHTMPDNRAFLVTCGLEPIVDYILNLRFTKEDIQFLKSQPAFRSINPKFFEYLRRFKFSGDVWAMPEGEICFADEPILQVEAPIIEAQILETYLLSIINIETLVATKAARVVEAASCDGSPRLVVDFGSRRAHGPEAATLAARAAYIAGCAGTSNVHAGRMFEIPIFGTMAHSWVQAFDSEETAFAKYHSTFPENTILLIDTYDTIQGLKKAIKLKQNIKGVRIDSGNLKQLSQQVRKILDQHGLNHVKIIVSGNLNEYKIKDLVKAKAPIDIFGVGTEMVVSRDFPALDLTYKLVQTKNRQGRVKNKAKLSQGKQTFPGRKQVFRKFNSKGQMTGDTIGLFKEKPPQGTSPLLKPIIRKGKLSSRLPSINKIREKVQEGLLSLPEPYLQIHTIKKYNIGYSKKIQTLKKEFVG